MSICFEKVNARGGNMRNNYLYHHGVKGQHWGIRKKTASSGGRKKRSVSDKEKEKIKQHHIHRAQASIKAGAQFMKKNAPTIAAATVSVAFASAQMTALAPLASAAVSTSMNTIAAAAKAAKEYDEKIETTSATIVKKQLDGLNNSK